MRLSIACFHLPVFKGSTGPQTIGLGWRGHMAASSGQEGAQGTWEQRPELVSVGPREG